MILPPWCKQVMMMIKEFLNYLRFEKNRSALTVKNYGKDLMAFEEFFRLLEPQLSWESIDSNIIRDWMESMMDRGNNATSINRRLSALRSFYRFALTRGLVDKDPTITIVGPKKKKPLPQFVKESEMDALLDFKLEVTQYKDVLAHTSVETFYCTGMRLAELMGLDDASIDFTHQSLKVLGKRNKERYIPFGAELKESLQHYVSIRDEQVQRQSMAFFVDKDGQRLTHNQVRYAVNKCLSTVTTLKKRTPHVLRHTFATAMMNHGAGLESVQQLLGHQSLTTTEVYTHTTFEQLKRVYMKAHPRA